MTAGSAVEALLGVALPVDDPGETARAAARLEEAAARLETLTRGLATLLPSARWSGVAAHAADHRLLDVTLALAHERTRIVRAANALIVFSHRVAAAQHSAAQARSLLGAAYRAQQIADQADATSVLRPANQWSGPRDDGVLFDPNAQRLLGQGRLQADAARTTYDTAARELADELTELSGRRIVRAGLSPRVLLDVAGFVPVVGDAVDAANAALYLWQRRWNDGLVTAAAAVPGPEGWVAGGVHAGKAVDRAGDVEKVVDDLPLAERATRALSSLTQHGRRPTTRLLPDDDTIERLYRDYLAPLGPTQVIETPNGTVWLTRLEDGTTFSFRPFSASGGAAIEISGRQDLSFDLIHRR